MQTKAYGFREKAPFLIRCEQRLLEARKVSFWGSAFATIVSVAVIILAPPITLLAEEKRCVTTQMKVAPEYLVVDG